MNPKVNKSKKITMEIKIPVRTKRLLSLSQRSLGSQRSFKTKRRSRHKMIIRNRIRNNHNNNNSRKIKRVN